MSTKTRATIEDLYKVQGKAELVDGEIVEMSPAGDEPNVAGGEIFASLREYARRTGRGRAYTDGIGFHVRLPHREAFSAGVATGGGCAVCMNRVTVVLIRAFDISMKASLGRAARPWRRSN